MRGWLAVAGCVLAGCGGADVEVIDGIANVELYGSVNRQFQGAFEITVDHAIDPPYNRFRVYATSDEMLSRFECHGEFQGSLLRRYDAAEFDWEGWSCQVQETDADPIFAVSRTSQGGEMFLEVENERPNLSGAIIAQGYDAAGANYQTFVVAFLTGE